MLNFNAIYLYFSIFVQYIMLVQQIEIMQVFLRYLIKWVVEGSSFVYTNTYGLAGVFTVNFVMPNLRNSILSKYNSPSYFVTWIHVTPPNYITLFLACSSNSLLIYNCFQLPESSLFNLAFLPISLGGWNDFCDLGALNSGSRYRNNPIIPAQYLSVCFGPAVLAPRITDFCPRGQLASQ